MSSFPTKVILIDFYLNQLHILIMLLQNFESGTISEKSNAEILELIEEKFVALESKLRGLINE
jgi:hypothetical protein